MADFSDIFDKSLRLITAPESEPITVADAKAHCGVIGTTQFDTQFESWIKAARQKVELDSERCLMPQEWELTLDRFPCPTPAGTGNLSIPDFNPRIIELRRVPVIEITGFDRFDDTESESVEVDDADYILNIAAEPGILTPLPNVSWPPMIPRQRGIVITWNAGYEDDDLIPETALQAMRLLIGHWWRTRESAGERPAKNHESGYDALINSLRWR